MTILRSLRRFVVPFVGMLALLLMAPTAIAVGSRGGGSRTHRRLLKFTVTAAANGETDTTIDLPAKALVIPDGCFIDVRTAEVTGATKTLDVGLLSTEAGGARTGFMIDIDVSSTGIKVPDVATTEGTNETYFSSNTLGTFLSEFVAGSDVAGDVGTFAKRPHSADAVTAKSICINAPNAMVELVADVYLEILVPE